MNLTRKLRKRVYNEAIQLIYSQIKRGNYHGGLCYYTWTACTQIGILQRPLIKFKEIWNQKPENPYEPLKRFWFDPNDYEIRLTILYNAIKQIDDVNARKNRSKTA